MLGKESQIRAVDNLNSLRIRLLVYHWPEGIGIQPFMNLCMAIGITQAARAIVQA
jgi:hypothetical protein